MRSKGGWSDILFAAMTCALLGACVAMMLV